AISAVPSVYSISSLCASGGKGSQRITTARPEGGTGVNCAPSTPSSRTFIRCGSTVFGELGLTSRSRRSPSSTKNSLIGTERISPFGRSQVRELQFAESAPVLQCRDSKHH